MSHPFCKKNNFEGNTYKYMQISCKSVQPSSGNMVNLPQVMSFG